MVGSWLTRTLVEAGSYVVALLPDWDPQSELIRSGVVKSVNVVNGRLEDYEAVERAINTLTYNFNLLAEDVDPREGADGEADPERHDQQVQRVALDKEEEGFEQQVAVNERAVEVDRDAFLRDAAVLIGQAGIDFGPARMAGAPGSRIGAGGDDGGAGQRQGKQSRSFHKILPFG